MRRRALLAIASAATTILAVLLTVAPVAPPAAALVGPNWLLCVVAFWRTRAPALAPYPAIFAAGLSLDLLRDGPVGLETAALLIVLEGLTRWSEHRAPRSGWGALGRFALAAAAFEAIVAGALLATFAAVPGPEAIALRWALTVAIFAPLAATGMSGRGDAAAGGVR